VFQFVLLSTLDFPYDDAFFSPGKLQNLVSYSSNSFSEEIRLNSFLESLLEGTFLEVKAKNVNSAFPIPAATHD
jgi:hypothetical protein